MKRIISLILAMAVFATAFSFSTFSKSDNNKYGGYPVVLVPGYASASLCYDDENGETHAAWGWEIGDIISPVIKSSGNIIKGAAKFSGTGDDTELIKSISDLLLNILDAMRCNPDGTSVKNVRPILVKASETCDSYMNEKYPDGDYRVELDMTRELDKLVGEENVFYFNCDFRMSAVDCANDLNNYIEDVKQYTGSDKVNIVAVSHGGLITATYLSLYLDKGDLYNVVMDEPALTGAGIAADMLKCECDFDEETMVRYLEYHSMCETDFNWLVRAHQLGFLDDVLQKMIPQIKEGLLYWCSIWDFIAPEDYEELKAENLDPVESAELIKKSDYVHYQVMANYKEIFSSAQNAGVRVNIIAGSGNRILSGQNDISDGIITVKSSTGAYTVPFGERFDESYVQYALNNGRVISPAMDIDVTDAYLPNNTWIVNGLFHGMEFWDQYSRSLLFKLLLTDEPIDVNTLPDYPQFMDTTSATCDVYAEFDNSTAGYIGTEDKKLIIKNCSSSKRAYILSIKSQGVELEFNLDKAYSIAPGESIAVPISGKIPKGITYSGITVSYIMAGSVTPISSRTQVFTAINGCATENSEEKTVLAGFKDNSGKKSDSFPMRLAKKIGMQELVNIINDSDSSRFFKFFIYK